MAKDSNYRLRILFVIDSLKFGGAERQLVELIKGIDKKRFDIFLCVLNDAEAGFASIVKELGVPIYCTKREFSIDPRPILSITSFIRKNRIDVVHAFLTLGALLGVIASRLAGTPVVCSGVRDAKDQSPFLALQKKIEARLSNVFVSNSLAGLRNRFKSMKPHFRVVYNGIDFTRFKGNSRESDRLKEELGIERFGHVVGMVASLSEYKDQETLLRAVPLVLEKVSNTCFLLIGDGSEREKLIETAQRLGISGNVIFTGYRPDVEKFHSILDVSALLTKNEIHLEGISNSILESMACGVPVIASSGGGTDEVIEHGQNGLLVEPSNAIQLADHITHLLSDKDFAARMGGRASIDVRKRFGLERYVADYVHLYEEAINGPMQ